MQQPTVSGPGATPAGDGIANLLKYALGLDPKANGTAGLPTVAVTTNNGSRYLTLTYTSLLAATDITRTVEVSSDLQTWSFGPNSTTPVSATNNPDGRTQTVVVRDLTPLDAAARRFIHLKVSNP